MVFSVIVKFKTFTKHILSQSIPSTFFARQSYCCSAIINGQVCCPNWTKLRSLICLVNSIWLRPFVREATLRFSSGDGSEGSSRGSSQPPTFSTQSVVRKLSA
jgi:hypothetical protein